jgi:hypothetical protein
VRVILLQLGVNAARWAMAQLHTAMRSSTASVPVCAAFDDDAEAPPGAEVVALARAQVAAVVWGWTAGWAWVRRRAAVVGCAMAL